VRHVVILFGYILCLIAGAVGAQETTICPSNASYWERWQTENEVVENWNNYVWDPTIVAVDPTGDLLAVATKESLALYDPQTLDLVRELEMVSQEEQYDHFSVGWSPEANQLAVLRLVSTPSSEPDPRSGIQLWDVEQAQMLRTLPIEAKAMAWSPDSSMIAVADLDGVISLWDPDRGISVELADIYAESTFLPDALAWSPDGNRLAVGGASGGNYLLLSIEEGDVQMYRPEETRTGAHYIAWSPNGAYFAIGNQYRTIWLWDLETESITRTLDGFDGNPFDMRWSPDGSLLARGTQNGLYLWDMTSNNTQPVRVFNENMPPFVRMTWLPDSQHLISVDFEGSIYRWDVETGCVEAAVLKEWQP
jgi:WD40 repeat protein